jgi:hypothetical protein
MVLGRSFFSPGFAASDLQNYAASAASHLTEARSREIVSPGTAGNLED